MTSRRLFSGGAVLALMALAGCASMSESECRSADWQRIGWQDGSQGRPESRLADHHEACSKIGVAPDGARYRRGWDEGVLSYCTPAVGWREGLRGASYQGVCRGRNEAAFLQYHGAGYEVYRVESELESNNGEIRRLQSQLDKAKNDDERRKLRERLRDLDREQARLRSQASQLRLYGPR